MVSNIVMALEESDNPSRTVVKDLMQWVTMLNREYNRLKRNMEEVEELESGDESQAQRSNKTYKL